MYCFLGYKYGEGSDYSYSIERCNLRKAKRTWEIVNVLGVSAEERSINCPKIMTRYFGVSHYSEGVLLIIGGDEISNNETVEIKKKIAYLYDTVNDSVKEFGFMSFKSSTKQESEDKEVNIIGEIFPEKYFLPMMAKSERVNALFPYQTTDKVKVVLLNSANNVELKEFEDELNNSSTLEEEK